MINLTYTPQRADIKATYMVKGDFLTTTINDVEEIFDFTNIADGILEEIVIESLPVNPILTVERVDDNVNITVIRFYGEDEKNIFETQ